MGNYSSFARTLVSEFAAVVFVVLFVVFLVKSIIRGNRVKELEKEIVKETRVKERQRNEERVLNNLDMNVLQMAKDIRFLKNVVIATLIADGVIASIVVIAMINFIH